MSGALDLPALLRAAELAARAGGAIVADRFGTTGNAHEKAPGDWVSEADTTSESVVRDELERHAPELPVFGEEGGGARGDVGWFVDPLDGTATSCTGFRPSAFRSRWWSTAFRSSVSCTRLYSAIPTPRDWVPARSGTAIRSA